MNGVAHEAKARIDVQATTSVRRQIDRDAELIATGRLGGAHWHFFQGASPEVKAYLESRGIPYTATPSSDGLRVL